MNNVIIAGTSQFSCVLCKILQKEGIEVLGFTVDRAYKTCDYLEGLPVVPFEDIKEKYENIEFQVALSFGYSKMSKLREHFLNKIKSEGFVPYTFISRNALVYTDNIGEGSLILPNVYIGPYTAIGKACIIWNGCNISHHDVIDDYCFIAPSCALAGDVTVKNNTFIGVHSSVKNGIIIESYNLIAANSYISRNTEKNSVYVGIPAKKRTELNPFEEIEKALQ